MISFWQALILVGIVALSILGAMLIGAYAVYKTKREPHEPFIGKPAEGAVFSLDDLEDKVEAVTEQPEIIRKRNSALLDQLSAREGGG